MSVSTVGSSSSYPLKWPSQSGVDSTDKSGAPSDPLLALFAAFKGGSGQSDPPPPPPDDASSGCPQFSSDTMSAMISMLGQGNGGTSPLDSLVSKFDADGDGKISQSEFEKAAGTDADQTKADALFAKMDGDGDGTVTKGELASAIQKARGGHGHHHHHSEQAGGGQSMDPLKAMFGAQQADGTTSQSTTNSDGSTTTTLTYGDGTKIAMTTPVAAAGSTTSGTDALNASSLKSMIERMIAAQAQMLTQQNSTNISA